MKRSVLTMGRQVMAGIAARLLGQPNQPLFTGLGEMAGANWREYLAQDL